MGVLLGVVVVLVVGWLMFAGGSGGDAPVAAPTSSVASASVVSTSVPGSSSVTSSTVVVTTSTVVSRLVVAESVGPSPVEVELPVVDDVGAVVKFLSGNGAALVEFVAATSDLYALEVSGVGVCEAFAGELDGTVEAPVVLSKLATRVPDAVTSELFVSDIALKVRLLGSCGGDDVVGLAGEVAWQSELLERRLTELGVEW